VLYFIFQRQRFEVDEQTQTVHELDSPTSLTLREYVQHTGLRTDSQIQSKADRYGDNSVEIPLPSFKEIYLKQILGPVPIFQVRLCHSHRCGYTIEACAIVQKHYLFVSMHRSSARSSGFWMNIGSMPSSILAAS
jgi:hypothetical protein